MEEKNTHVSNLLLTLSIIMLLIVLLLKAFTWTLMDTLTVFLFPFLQIFIYVISIIIIIVLLYKCIRSFKKEFNIQALIGIIVILCFVISFILPIDEYAESIRFRVKSNQFDEAAILMLENDYISDTVSLPTEYQGLSRDGGEVIIVGEDDAKTVMFFSFSGVLDNYSVYAYAANKDSYNTLKGYENWKQIKKLRDNWYFCTSY